MKRCLELVFVVLAAAAMGCGGDDDNSEAPADGGVAGGCKSDMECKADRICVNRKCVDPSEADPSGNGGGSGDGGDGGSRAGEGGASGGDGPAAGDGGDPGEGSGGEVGSGGGPAGSGGVSGSGGPVAGTGQAGQGTGGVQPTGGSAGDCQSTPLVSEIARSQVPGTLLVLFDRSGSMAENWGSLPRCEVVGQALINALAPLSDGLTVGGIFFPSPAEPTGEECNIADPLHWLPGGPCLEVSTGGVTSCEVNPITAEDQIDFCPASDFIAALPSRWMLPAGGTPLQAAVDRAEEALSALGAGVGGVTVVLLTDGPANCSDVLGLVDERVSIWLSNGIQTHVIGVQVTDANAVPYLDALAGLGGTGSVFQPADPAALEAHLSTIVSNISGVAFDDCIMRLESPVTDSPELHLVAALGGGRFEVPRALEAGGWSVQDGGASVRLEGSLCDDARNGRFSDLQLELGCVALELLP